MNIACSIEAPVVYCRFEIEILGKFGISSRLQ